VTDRSIPPTSAKRGPQTARERQHRQPTGHDRVSYRERSDGTRTYYVFHRRLRAQGKSPYVKADGGLKAALALRAELDSRTNRGERTLLPSKRTVVEVANEWYAAEHGRWRDSYERNQRRNLDNEVLPEFGHWAISAVGPADVLAFDRKTP
jgi:Phage integrase, N-terminal SAM-like domain